MYSFEWDTNKNAINQNKHGVSFEEAETVFYDDNALLEYDELHSDKEDRFRIKPGAKLQQARLIGASDAVNRRRELQLLRASVGDLDPPLTFEDGTRRLRKLRGGGHLASVIGCSIAGNILLVVHCIRNESVIRIISSRKTTAAEEVNYERMAGL